MKHTLRSDQILAVNAGIHAIQQHNGILIADEPGYGKSFEALGIAHQLNHPILILCPASLIPTWRAYTKHLTPTPTLLSHTALALLKPHQILQRFQLPLTLIVDEAHHFTNPQTLRYKNLSLLALGKPLILLTATPFQNHVKDVLHLLALFSPHANYARQRTLNLHTLQSLLNTLTISRRRPTTRPLHRHQTLLTLNTEPIEQLAQLLAFPHEPQQLFLALLLKRALSTPAALHASASRLLRYLQECQDNQTLLPRTSFDTDFPHGQTTFPFLHTQTTLPHDLHTRIQSAKNILNQLPTTLPHLQLIHQLPKPAVIFTCYKHSARDLFRQLSPYYPTILWTGSTLTSNTWINLTTDNLPLTPNTILIATDVANHGVNLDAAQSLLHLDLPWNPYTTIQREGRITRSTNLTPAHIHTLRPPPNVEGLLHLITINQTKERLAERWLYQPHTPTPLPTLPHYIPLISPKLQQLAGVLTYDQHPRNTRSCLYVLHALSKYAPAGLQTLFQLLQNATDSIPFPLLQQLFHTLGVNIHTAPYPRFTFIP